ncbi:PLP-dependent aminotransferase family protein [Pelosinus sp. IPA-1]|uniref:MocR-like pyridoxine biosynthesis transcription factor PdxR n=1 Tax=Pelosinus sp. IPA-1 TaxID=3029569 RepID=UPI002436271A|nr:PLP-dependent aminotransferase family protein [Pelosinus sp. IPA-1]GMA98125.1 transcriptional regulator [Pelosinus sp. IPA-1]
MLYIAKDIQTPIYEQIYTSLMQEILSGSLKFGDKLPATRKLAAELSVGRNTVDKAYQQLVAEGYVTAIVGSGFTINKIASEFYVPNQADFSTPTYEPKTPSFSTRYDFAYGAIDNSIFPHKQWRKSINNALTLMESYSCINYPNRQGETSLRQSISHYLKRSRGVCCNASQVIITCGHQHSMEIIANMFETSSKRFAMEDPGYDGIRIVFQNHKYQVVPIPVEKDGVSIESIEALNTDLLYLTPSHQFPTGVVLSIAKRRKLLQWAFNTNSYLIEDDYDSELRYDTNPIPSLQSLDNHDRTIYTGTFSKSLSPSMRVAYLVLPHSLVDTYKHYYHRYNSQVSVLHQTALSDFISSGNYEKHMNRLRTFYRKRQNALLTALDEVFGNTTTISGEGAGMHILLTIKNSLTQDELIKRAESIGIRIYSPSANYMNPTDCPRSQILLGFATIPTCKFKVILEELYHVWNNDFKDSLTF